MLTFPEFKPPPQKLELYSMGGDVFLFVCSLVCSSVACSTYYCWRRGLFASANRAALTCYIGNRTFRYFASSPPGRLASTLDVSFATCMGHGWFATWTFRTFGRFDTRTFRYLPGRFATGRQRSFYSIANYKLSDRWRNVQGGCKRPGIETSTGAKRSGGESSRW